MIFVGTFPVTSSTQFQRLLLIHIFLALINFKGDSIQAMKKLNNYETYKKDSYINLKSFYNNNMNLPNKEINDLLELLIFEYYFLKIIIIHFSKVFNEIFRKEFLNLNQTRFKNLYILDLESSSIILDMLKIQGVKGDNHNKKYINNKSLFDEILYHSRNMLNSYVSKNGMKYTTTNSIFRFVKFECTSTFPRLLFIIKFIPVLKGITVIHLYYQKKLSRNLENNPLEEELKYKEIDLLFGSYIRNNQNLEFKYGAPKKLQHVEKFFEDFFITSRSGYDLFRVNSNNKFKYVNYSIINIINSVPVSNNIKAEQIFENINKKLEEEYNIMKNKKNNDEEDKEEEINKNEEEDNSVNNIFILNKETIYNEILNLKDNNKKDKNKNNIINNIKTHLSNINNNITTKKLSNIFMDSFSRSLLLEEEDKKDEVKKINKSFIKKYENNINSNLGLNNFINSEESTERKNLIRKDIYNDNLILNSPKISNFESLSIISEVKTKEKFRIKELKTTNIKSHYFKDKLEDINNEFMNEKEVQLTDLLDFTNINQKTSKDKNQNDDNNQIKIKENKSDIKNESKKVINDSISEY